MSGRRFNRSGSQIINGKARASAGKQLLLPNDIKATKQELVYADAVAAQDQPPAQTEAERLSEACAPQVNRHKRVANATLESVELLAQAWAGEPTMADIRRTALDAFYRAWGASMGLRLGTIESALPALEPEGERAFLASVRSLPYSELPPDYYGVVVETLTGFKLDGRKLMTSDGRRRTGVHYKPSALAATMAAKTLAPIFPLVPPERTLELRLCDPSTGGGVFPLALIRLLAPRVLSAGLAKDEHEAKRLVAIHCIYAIDVDHLAVLATKRAITLECRADRMPETWLDDNIKCGDALVGLDAEQMKAFHWKPGAEAKTVAPELFGDPVAQLITRAMELGAAARKLRMTILSERARGAT